MRLVRDETAMIPATPSRAQPRHWQKLWRESIVDPHELLELLDLGHLDGQLLPRAETGFSMRVPRGFAARMRRGDASDPLLLQVLPRAAELDEVQSRLDFAERMLAQRDRGALPDGRS